MYLCKEVFPASRRPKFGRGRRPSATFRRMRRVWLNAFGVAAAVSFGACAAGTVESGSAGSPWGGTPVDAGSSAPQSNSGDSGDPPGTAPSPGNDAGQPAPPSSDSGPGPAGPDSAAPPAVDSGPVVSDDSGGGPPPSATDCPSNAKYFGEWSVETIAGGATPCTSGSACTLTQCCYGGTSGVGLCVPL